MKQRQAPHGIEGLLRVVPRRTQRVGAAEGRRRLGCCRAVGRGQGVAQREM